MSYAISQLNFKISNGSAYRTVNNATFDFDKNGNVQNLKESISVNGKAAETEFFKVVVTISRIKRLVIFAVVALLQDLALLALQARSSSPPEFPSVSGFHL